MLSRRAGAAARGAAEPRGRPTAAPVPLPVGGQRERRTMASALARGGAPAGGMPAEDLRDIEALIQSLQTRRQALRVYGPSQWMQKPSQQSSSGWEVGPDRLLEQRRHCPHNRVCRAGAQVVGARAAWLGETQMAVQRSPRICLLQAQPCFRKHVVCGNDGRRRCVMCC